MKSLNPRYIINEEGKKEFVILSMHDFEQIVEALEELEDIRLYDEAIIAEDSNEIMEGATMENIVIDRIENSSPAEEVFERIELKRQKKHEIRSSY